MKTENRKLYIEVFKYCSEKEIFRISDIVKDLELDKNEENAILFQVRRGHIFLPTETSPVQVDAAIQRDEKFRLNIEDEFRILEYEELQEARESSKQATRWATRALCISIASLLISTFVSLFIGWPEIMARFENPQQNVSSDKISTVKEKEDVDAGQP